MASYRTNMNSSCYCQNGGYRQRPIPTGDRQVRRNIPVTPANDREKRESCQECACKREEDPLQKLPIAMAYVPWQQWRDLHDLCYGFQCGTIFQELEKPFQGKGGCCQ